MNLRAFIFTLLATSAVSNQAVAGIIFDVVESGGNVDVTLSGSFNLSATHGFAFVGDNNLFAGFFPTSGNISIGDVVGPPYDTDNYNMDPGSNWTPFGTGGFGAWDSASGSIVSLFSNPLLGLPVGYMSGDSLSGTAAKIGATFASLGFTVGSFVTTFTNDNFTDSVTINIGRTVTVPEPATVALLGVALAGLGFSRRRKLH